MIMEKTQVIESNAELISAMREHLSYCVESTKADGVRWSDIDKEWALYDFLPIFAPELSMKDAKTLVHYVMGGKAA